MHSRSWMIFPNTSLILVQNRRGHYGRVSHSKFRSGTTRIKTVLTMSRSSIYCFSLVISLWMILWKKVGRVLVAKTGLNLTDLGDWWKWSVSGSSAGSPLVPIPKQSLESVTMAGSSFVTSFKFLTQQLGKTKTLSFVLHWSPVSSSN